MSDSPSSVHQVVDDCVEEQDDEDCYEDVVDGADVFDLEQVRQQRVASQELLVGQSATLGRLPATSGKGDIRQCFNNITASDGV